MYGVPILAGSTAAAISGMAWAVRGRSSAVFGPSLWRGPREHPTLALTFDDGPSESTPQILAVLEQYRASATFFQCGANVARLPSVAQAVARAGHEIGNHSYTHPLFCFRRPGFAEDDLRRAQETIERHTGSRPRWFRAPYGVRWFGMRKAQHRLSLTAVMWSIIGYDWNRKASEIVERVCSRVSNGDILCLHDGRELLVRPDIGVTVEAVRILVPMLLDRGYKFETVSRLICPTN